MAAVSLPLRSGCRQLSSSAHRRSQRRIDPRRAEQELAELQEPGPAESFQTVAVSDPNSAERVLDIIYGIHYRQPGLFWACDTEAADIDVKAQSPIGHGRVIAATIYAGKDLDFGGGSVIFLDNLDHDDAVLQTFKRFFEDETVLKVWHNYGFDRHILYNHGIDCKGFGGDTMHLARLHDPSRSGKGAYSLEGLSRDYLYDRKITIKERFGKKLLKDGSISKINVMPNLEELQRNENTRPEWIEYAASDAVLTWRLREFLAFQLQAKPLRLPDFHDPVVQYDKDCGSPLSIPNSYQFYECFWRPFGELLTDMERAGIFLQTKWLAQAQKRAEADAERLWNLFRQWAAKQCPDAKFMNPRSNSQVQQLLFAPFKHGDIGLANEREFKTENVYGVLDPAKKVKKYLYFKIQGLGLAPVSLTPRNLPSADSASLAALAGTPYSDPPKFGRIYYDFGEGEKGKDACLALDAAVKASRIEKLLNTYLVPLQTLIDSESRIHCSLNLNTETGRLSARKPNLQNQPSLDKDFYRIRQAFAAAPGCSLVIADYGQLELRLLAHLSRCKSMINAFKAGGDFHSRTAMSMYDEIKVAVNRGEVLLEWDFSQGPSPKPLLKDKYAAERRQAKTLNFSIAYGKTARGLANDWGVSVEEAEDIVRRWYSDRPEVKEWQEKQKSNIYSSGEVGTLMGRGRKVYDIHANQSPSGNRFQHQERFPVSISSGLPIHFGDYDQTGNSGAIQNNRGNTVVSSTKQALSEISSKRKRFVGLGRANRLAINTPVQGSAADVVMMAMINLWRNERLRHLGWKLLLQIHDEVILEGPSESSDEALSLVRQIMEHPFPQPLLVDLVVDAKVVQNWYQAK